MCIATIRRIPADHVVSLITAKQTVDTAFVLHRNTLWTLNKSTATISYCASFIFPFASTRYTLKEELHSFRSGQREKYSFAVIAAWAVDFRRARKCGVSAHILDYRCGLCRSMVYVVSIYTVITRIYFVFAISASVNQPLAFSIFLWIQ